MALQNRSAGHWSSSFPLFYHEGMLGDSTQSCRYDLFVRSCYERQSGSIDGVLISPTNPDSIMRACSETVNSPLIIIHFQDLATSGKSFVSPPPFYHEGDSKQSCSHHLISRPSYKRQELCVMCAAINTHSFWAPSRGIKENARPHSWLLLPILTDLSPSSHKSKASKLSSA